MIQSIKEYQQLAKRTCPTLGSKQEDLLHMKLGVYTETGELLDVIKKHLAYGKVMDVINVGEEIADICWYLVNLSTFEGNQLMSIPKSFARIQKIPDVVMWCERIMACFIEDDNEELLEQYGHYNRISIMKSISSYFELDFMQILTNNIDKLKIRYPDKFDADKAINRNLERERTELEK